MKRISTVRYLFTIFAGFTIFVLSFTTFAQAPSNDECSAAISVNTIPYDDLTTNYTSANTNGATRSTPDPSCITSSDNNDDIWYKFVANTQVELLRVHSAVSGSIYVTFGYALYDSCGGSEMVCNNQMGTFYGNEMLGGLTSGHTYFLRFWSLHNFTFMTFSFAVMDIDPGVPSDEQLTATPLSINSPGVKCNAPQFFTTTSASRSSPNPSCSNDNDDDVWFQFICPSNGVFIDLEEGALVSAGGSPTLGIEFTDASSGLSVGCSIIHPGFSSLFSSGSGDVIQVRIWTIGTTDRAVFSLCLQDGVGIKPDNDTCAAATNLQVGSGNCTNPVIGNLFNADITSSLTGNPNCTVNTTLKNDVWYKATLPASGNLIVQTSATNSEVNDLVLLAYTNNCGTFSQIACDEDGNPDPFPSANHPRISLTGRTPGEIILYRVLPRNGSNMGEFSVCAFDTSLSALPSISINDVKANEGDSGTTLFQFKVSLSSASTDTVKMSYKTVDGTAKANSDYVPVSSTTLKINPGKKAGPIKIKVIGDTINEPNEGFKVRLFDAENAVITDNTGKGTIENDDGPVALGTLREENFSQKEITGKINIYPTIVYDKLNIDLPSGDAIYNIALMDVTGRVITVQNSASNQTIIVKAAQLNRGVYFVRVTSATSYDTFKIIKQ